MIASASAQVTVSSEDLDIRSKDVRVKIVAAVKGDSNIIGYVKDGSKISFNDGKKDLGGGFRFSGKFSEGGSVMKILAKSDEPASKDVETIKITGNLDVLLASKSSTHIAKKTEFKKGDEMKAGDDLKFTVVGIGEHKRNDRAIEIILNFTRKQPGKILEIKGMRFYSEAGALITSEKQSTSSYKIFGKDTIKLNYLLKDGPKSNKIAKMEIDLWRDLKKVTVPLDMTLIL